MSSWRFGRRGSRLVGALYGTLKWGRMSLFVVRLRAVFRGPWLGIASVVAGFRCSHLLVAHRGFLLNFLLNDDDGLLGVLRVVSVIVVSCGGGGGGGGRMRPHPGLRRGARSGVGTRSGWRVSAALLAQGRGGGSVWRRCGRSLVR